MTVVSPTSTTPVRVATSTTVATLAAAAAGRKMVLIYNDSAGNLFVKFGATATSTDFTTKLPAGALFELPSPVYGGIVTGILDAGTGNAQVTAY